MLTVFLRHDGSKTRRAVGAEMRNGWCRSVLPPGVEIVSWHVTMGVGQVVTLRTSPDKLREVRVIDSRLGRLPHGVPPNLRRPLGLGRAEETDG